MSTCEFRVYLESEDGGEMLTKQVYSPDRPISEEEAGRVALRSARMFTKQSWLVYMVEARLVDFGLPIVLVDKNGEQKDVVLP